MKTISRLADLERYGIISLTGEADNLCFRMLCDLTDRGRRLIAETYSLKTEGFNDAWNPGTDSDPHVASMMLPYDAWKDIGVLALLVTCSTVLVTDGGGLFGIEKDESYEPAPYNWDKSEYTGRARYKHGGEWHDWPTSCYGEIVRTFKTAGNQPHEGHRNVHAMSGRTI